MNAWVYCSDRQPEKPGRYRVAAWTPSGVRRGEPLRKYLTYALFEPQEKEPRYRWTREGLSPVDVYAWENGVEEEPPPMRPQDRRWLLDQGVPNHWLLAEVEEFKRVTRLREKFSWEEFQEWLDEPSEQLEGKTPWDLIEEGRVSVVGDLVDAIIAGSTDPKQGGE